MTKDESAVLIEDEKKQLKQLERNARKRIVALVNELLVKCGGEGAFEPVASVHEISSHILIFIFERICNTTLIDKIQPASSSHDEIHNIQAIIDSLSLDILHEDLSYLTGEAIYAAIRHSKHHSGSKSKRKRCDVSSIEYLLDIFLSLHEWLASQIETTASTAVTSQDAIESNHRAREQPSQEAASRPRTASPRKSGVREASPDDMNKRLAELSLRDETPRHKSPRVVNKVSVTVEAEVEEEEANDDEEDVFASYLKEKEEEFKRRSFLSNTLNSTEQSQAVDQAPPNEPRSRGAERMTEAEWGEMTKKYGGGFQSQPNPDIDSNEFQEFLRNRAIIKARIDEEEQEEEQDDEEEASEPEESCRELQVQSLRSFPAERPHYKAHDLQLYHEHPNQQALLHNDFDVLRYKIDGQTGKRAQLVKTHLKKLYESDIKDMRSIMSQSLAKLRSRSELIENLYKDPKAGLSCRRGGLNSESSINNNNSSRESQPTAVRKSFLVPRERVIKPKTSCDHDCLSTSHYNNKSLTNRSVSSANSAPGRRRTMSATSSRRSRALSCASAKKRQISDEQLLHVLFDEFPYLYTSPETIHYLWQKNSKQIKLLNRLKDEIKNKYLKPNEHSLRNLTVSQLTDIQRRQQLQMEIVRSEQVSQQRREDLRRKQQIENSIKARQREQRSQNARIRRYYEEYRMQQKLKMIKHSAEEELIIKRLFSDIFKTQKERILDLKKYAKEKYELNNERQMAELESIENFYKNKFNLIRDEMSKEKRELEVREKSQQTVLNTLRKNLRSKLETEIKDLQGQLCDNESTLHWRNMDADRLKSELVAIS